MGRSADVPRDSATLDDSPDADAGCHILHVDMDAFFVSVEIRRDPTLAGRPVVVGGNVRGVVAAASYEARRYGIRSAMPMSQAVRMCRDLVVLPPDRPSYAAASGAVMSILRDVTPLVEPLSLDEAFLDVAGTVRRLGSPAAIARHVRARIAEEQHLTCSVGVARTKFVAKLASARCKPNGMLVIPVARVREFLDPLPVTVLWGVGARTAEQLHRLGIRTVADLAETPLPTLHRAVGGAVATHLSALAHGIDERSVQTGEQEKSISADHTTDTDLTDAADVDRLLLQLSEEVGRRVRDRGLVARTVGIKIRFADFSMVTRVRSLPGWVDATSAIHATARELYAGLDLDRPRIRLVGVKCENLRDGAAAPHQLSLDLTHATAGSVPADSDVDPALDRATDAVRARFGAAALGLGSLLPPAAPPPRP
jgi:DNA polymerase-4